MTSARPVPTSDDHTEPRSYWSGFLAGIAFAAGLVLLWFSRSFASLPKTYDLLRGDVPAVTALVIHPVFLPVAALLVLGLAFGVAYQFRFERTRFRFAIAAAAIGVSLVVLAQRVATAPLTQLSEMSSF